MPLCKIVQKNTVPFLYTPIVMDYNENVNSEWEGLLL